MPVIKQFAGGWCYLYLTNCSFDAIAELPNKIRANNKPLQLISICSIPRSYRKYHLKRPEWQSPVSVWLVHTKYLTWRVGQRNCLNNSADSGLLLLQTVVLLLTPVFSLWPWLALTLVSVCWFSLKTTPDFSLWPWPGGHYWASCLCPDQYRETAWSQTRLSFALLSLSESSWGIISMSPDVSVLFCTS